MRPPPHLPTQLVDEGARRLALAHLAAAAAARRGLRHDADIARDALHDYRVALRRLRSCLRAYRKPLRSTVTRKVERRLRRLARNTGPTRDLDVQLTWLNDKSTQAMDASETAKAWLTEHLSVEKARAWQRMLDRDAKLFPRLHRPLMRQLTELRTAIDPDPQSVYQRSTAMVTARRIRRGSRRLRADLQRIHDASRISTIHRARITVKRLRYLLEPFAGAMPMGQAAVQQLKRFQDDFGAMVDANVFVDQLDELIEASACPASLEPFAQQLRAERQRAFDTAVSGWLGEASAPLLQLLDAMAQAIENLVDQP